MMREMPDFAQSHHIRPVIEQMPISRVDEAIDLIGHNKIRYRIVLVNGRKAITAAARFIRSCSIYLDEDIFYVYDLIIYRIAEITL